MKKKLINNFFYFVIPISFIWCYFSTDWVLKLGPVEDDQYKYAVISDPIRLSLFVLARDPDDFNTRFEAEVLSFLSDDGFTRWINKPVAGVQGPECVYATFYYNKENNEISS